VVTPDLVWPEQVYCHREAGVCEWLPLARDGRLHCSHCNSVHPAWIVTTYQDLPRTMPPWTEPCGHTQHPDMAGMAACERAQLDRIASWTGIVPADQTFGWPHLFHCHCPRQNGIGQIRFYTIHLFDLDPLAFRVTADVLARQTGIWFDLHDGHLVYRIGGTA
jgi:hypothetical protein